MTRTAVLALGASLFALATAGTASAQVITTNSAQPSANLETPPPEVDRVAGPTLPPGVSREGVRIVRPAALLFASYDTNHDGKITDAEIDAGAAISFAVADKNSDGAITGFEQSDWATLVGGGSDVLANPAQFDTDLDRSVTKAEFISGMHRLADTLKKKGESVLTYADLVQPLQQPGSGAQASESGEAPPKGQKAKKVSPS